MTRGFYPNGRPRKGLIFGGRPKKKPRVMTVSDTEDRLRKIKEYLEKNEVKKLPPGYSHMDL